MKLMTKVAGILLLLAIFGVRVSAQELSLFGPLPVSPAPVSPPPENMLFGIPKPHLSKPHVDKPTRANFELGGGYMYTSLLQADQQTAEHEWIFDVRGLSHFPLVERGWRSFRGLQHQQHQREHATLHADVWSANLSAGTPAQRSLLSAKFLIGPGYSGYNLESQGGFNPYSHWGWSIAWMGGGGINVKFKTRWTIRLIESTTNIPISTRLMPLAMAALAREITALPWESFIASARNKRRFVGA